MANLSSDDAPDEDRAVISDGYFEHEDHLSRERTAELLRGLADQVENGTELTVSGPDWRIPFAFHGPVEVEVELEPGREPELELEFEFTGGRTDGELSIE